VAAGVLPAGLLTRGRVVLAAVLAVAVAAVASCFDQGSGEARTRVLVVGDSMVAVAAAADDDSAARLVGYAGDAPHVYDDPAARRMSTDWEAAGRPRTVVINWNGNNPTHLLGVRLVESYRVDLTRDIQWYLANGVTRIVLAAAVPSLLNNADHQVSWTSPESAEDGRMLGNAHLNDLYQQLATGFQGKVSYSPKAALALHPRMAFNTQLNGQTCIVDYIHPAPYCAKRYARALRGLAGADV
jgi:hypothetical protein